MGYDIPLSFIVTGKKKSPQEKRTGKKKGSYSLPQFLLQLARARGKKEAVRDEKDDIIGKRQIGKNGLKISIERHTYEKRDASEKTSKTYRCPSADGFEKIKNVSRETLLLKNDNVAANKKIHKTRCEKEIQILKAEK